MPETQTEIDKQSPVEAPLYTPQDAARYLKLPSWVILTLMGRFHEWPEAEWYFHHFRRGFPPAFLIDEAPVFPFPPGGEVRRLKFRGLVDLFIRAATFQVIVELSRAGGWSRDQWENLHHTIRRGLEDTQREPVAFGSSSSEELVEALAEPYARLAEEPASLLRKLFRLRLDRVEVQDAVPVRIYPFSRDPAESAPRIIVLDPQIRFGRPTIIGRGTPTDSLAERFQAGDSLADLVDDYALDAEQAEEALRFESLPVAPLFPFFGW
jgi:uncharacterized protein (DUF433 family)